jgi:hypothetical protein
MLELLIFIDNRLVAYRYGSAEGWIFTRHQGKQAEQSQSIYPEY